MIHYTEQNKKKKGSKNPSQSRLAGTVMGLPKNDWKMLRGKN